MAAKLWVTLRPPDPDRQYLALLTELPLARFRDLSKFFVYTFRIEAQLKKTPEVVGHSLNSRNSCRRYLMPRSCRRSPAR